MARLENDEKHYTPKYYEKADHTGSRIKPKQHAEEAAKYLAKTQWGDWEEENSGNPFEPLHMQGKKFNKYPPAYKTNQITSEEVDEAIYRTKKYKAPGPDGIPAEFFKLLDFKSRSFIVELFNGWFSGEQKIPAKHNSRGSSYCTKKGTRLCSKTTDLSAF